MPIATSSLLLGVNDAKISKLLTDITTNPTYSSSVDVPGISEVKVSPNFVEKELKGDEVILDYYSKLESVDWSFNNAKISLDALAILLGGTVSASGTTPNQKQTYSLLGTDKPNYFKLEAQSTYTEIGDAHVILYKCKASKVEYTIKGEDFAEVSASGKAIACISNSKVKDIVFNETAAAIS